MRPIGRVRGPALFRMIGNAPPDQRGECGDGHRQATEQLNEAQADEWKRWRASLAEPIRLSRRRERLADSNLTLEAAAQGYGIAMGREPLVSDLLRRGRLVAPLGHDYPTGGVYELLGHPSRLDHRRPRSGTRTGWQASSATARSASKPMTR